ncbi:MAG TPA: hypothetical protein VIM69_09770 [Opitutaceae bacterium]
MRASHYIVLAASLLAASAVWGMDNADLIKLKQASFSDETIIHTIDKQPANYDTSPSALVDLKNAGVSEAVINHILAKQNEPSSTEVTTAGPAPASTAAPAAVTPTENLAPPAPAAASSAAVETTTPPVAVPNPSVPDLFSIESPSIAPPLEQIVPGHDYFTRFSLHEEGGTYVTTNYARGSLVPINTPVHVDVISHRKIVLKRLDTGERLTIENVEKYSRKTMPEFASLLLSSVKTPVDRLAPPLVTAIETGEMRKGMTKEQVILARGYPPAHETPSTDDDRWKYWSSRFVTQTITFTNGRLTEGRDIP